MIVESKNRAMKVLVTGGSGRVGRYVVGELTQAGMAVRVLDTADFGDPNIEFVRGDITKMEDAERATRDMDVVIHLAAIPTETGEAEKIFRVNVAGTFNILEACARNQVRKIVFASSVCAYGFIAWAKRIVPPYFPVDERVALFSDNTYGMGKIMGEDLCRGYSARYNMDIIALRIATVTFPNAPTWKAAIRDISNPEHEVRPGLSLPEFIWQYVHPQDLAQAFRLSVQRLQRVQTGYEAFNIGAEDVLSSVPTLELVKRYYPDVPLMRKPAEFVGDEHRALYDISKAQEILGYNPQFTWHAMRGAAGDVEV